MRWSFLLLVGLVGFFTPVPPSKSSPPIREDLEVPWNDPRTDRTRYPLWFSYNTNRPDIQSKSGFFFIQENKVFWTHFNTECIPDHKHISFIGYLDKPYQFLTSGKPGGKCVSYIKSIGDKLQYREICGDEEKLNWVLYPYKS